MGDIVDQLIDDPCSTLNEADAAELRKLDPGVLKRLLLGLPTADSKVSEEEPEDDTAQVDELQEALASTQQHLRELLDAEKEIRSALNEFGVKTAPVVERQVAVANQRSTPHAGDLTPELVMEWVRKATNPTATALREGLSALRLSRQKSIDVIVNNTSEYTPQDLQRMSTADLGKLARVLEDRASRYTQEPILSWEGVGLADQSSNQTPLFRSGGTLDLPSTGTGTSPSY